MTDSELISLAKNASALAYAPYSGYNVGAAIECEGGEVFTGCNIESAAYGSTICAERCAVSNAVAHGRRDFIRIAVYADGDDYCVPCGNCRQVLYEFAPEMPVLCAKGNGEYMTVPLSDLLPHGFNKTYLT